jgi:Ca2+/H+ antiporter
MKKFLVLIMLAFTFVFVMPMQTKALQLPTDQIVLAVDIGQQVQSAVVYISNIGYDVQTFISTKALAQDIEPPNADLGDVIKIPAKGDTPGWIYWSVAVFVLGYSFIVKLIPTAKSWTIAAIFYRIGNIFIKDRASGGGTLKIVKVDKK